MSNIRVKVNSRPSKNKRKNKHSFSVFGNILIIIVLLIIIVFTLSITHGRQQYIEYAQMIPSPACLGSCPTLSSTQYPLKPTNSIGATGIPVASGTTITPAVSPAPTYGSGKQASEYRHSHRKQGNNSNISESIFQKILQFLISLINELLSLLGTGPISLPVQGPSPSPSSIPIPSISSPTGAITTVPSVNPTVKPAVPPVTPLQTVTEEPVSTGLIYGVTVDDISNLSGIVTALSKFNKRPTARIVFDDSEPASYYQSAVSQIHPVSNIMGELSDSSEFAQLSDSDYKTRVAQYLAEFPTGVDYWEVGNEVNGNWTGPYADVSAKVYEAYQQVKAAGQKTELTLYYNNGCGDGASELDPVAFTNEYIPADMRSGLNLVMISYYETQCNNIRPSAATLTAFFTSLHTLYPNAELGFGEIGFPNPSGYTPAAVSMVNYYYDLNINVPGYVGGYFWWYFAEDAVPYTQPLWGTINTAFNNMP